ncbi:MAG: hypothetical protein J1F36_03705 [Clostridiales bacterium]|nr:hypothetical protein [Clostridiales bacterium]
MKSKKPQIKRFIPLLVVLAVLVVALALTPTLARYIRGTNNLPGNFGSIGSTDPEVNYEDARPLLRMNSDDSITVSFQVGNTEYPVYVRVAIIITWKKLIVCECEDDCSCTKCKESEETEEPDEPEATTEPGDESAKCLCGDDCSCEDGECSCGDECSCEKCNESDETNPDECTCEDCPLCNGEDNTVLFITPKEGTDYTITLNLTNQENDSEEEGETEEPEKATGASADVSKQWTLVEDDDYNAINGFRGYYYYQSPVASNGTTDALVAYFKQKENVEPPLPGYALNIEFIVQTIQAVGSTDSENGSENDTIPAYEDAWGVKRNKDTNIWEKKAAEEEKTDPPKTDGNGDDTDDNNGGGNGEVTGGGTGTEDNKDDTNGG